MAINALNGIRRVCLVFYGIKFRSSVTLQANCRARGAQFQAVGIVTVAAGDAGLVHPALQEGTINIYLVKHMSVRVIQRWIYERGHIVVQKACSRIIAFGYA